LRCLLTALPSALVDSTRTARLLTIETLDGSALTVTPDHVIMVDEIYAPAAEATVPLTGSNC